MAASDLENPVQCLINTDSGNYSALATNVKILGDDKAVDLIEDPLGLNPADLYLCDLLEYPLEL